MSSSIRRRPGIRTLVTVLVSAGMVTGAMTAFSSSPAAAVGTTHRLASSPRSTGFAVEGAARIRFTCNDVTGAAQLVVTNVQLIEADGVTPWQSPNLGFMLENASFTRYLLNESTFGSTLSQNTTNGLYGLKLNFNMGDLETVAGPQQWKVDAMCATGVHMQAIDYNAAGSLVLNSLLT